MCFKRRHSVPIVLLTSPRGPSVSETWYSPGHHIVTHISSSLFYIGSFLCVQAYLFVIYKKKSFVIKMSYLLHRAKLLRVTSSSTWRGVTSLPVKTLNCHISRTRHTSIPVYVLNWDQVTSILYTKNRAISSTETWRIWPLFVPFDPAAAAVTFFPCPTVLTWNASDVCWYP